MNHMINLISLLLISYLYFLFSSESSNEPIDANNPQISDVFASSSEPVSGNGSLLIFSLIFIRSISTIFR